MISLQKILEKQFEAYKEIQVQDVYKLLYQGTFGCEHAVDEKSKKILYEEYEKAKPNEKENLVERISPDSFIYRVHIRPYKSDRGKKEILFEWFYESSKIKEGTTQNFLVSWHLFKEVNKQKYYFLTEEIEDFEKTLKKEYSEKKRLPVMHHSEQYRKANNPSYRVVNYIVLHQHMKNLMNKT